MSYEQNEQIEVTLAEIRHFLAALQAAEQASAAPCPACAELVPAHYRYCDLCGAVLPGGAK